MKKKKADYCKKCGGFIPTKIKHVCKGTKPKELKLVPTKATKAKTICKKCKREGCSLVSWQNGKCCRCTPDKIGFCNWCSQLKKEKGLDVWVK